MVQAANRSEMGKRNGGNMLSAQSTERALLTDLLARLRTLDADVYVGHNISAFDLDVLLHRLQHHKARHIAHDSMLDTLLLQMSSLCRTTLQGCLQALFTAPKAVGSCGCKNQMALIWCSKICASVSEGCRC